MADKPSTTKTTNGKTITLMDGTEISVRPLKLSLLRPFMTKFALLQEASEDNDKSITKWRLMQLDGLCELVVYNSSRNASPVAINGERQHSARYCFGRRVA